MLSTLIQSFIGDTGEYDANKYSNNKLSCGVPPSPSPSPPAQPKVPEATQLPQVTSPQKHQPDPPQQKHHPEPPQQRMPMGCWMTGDSNSQEVSSRKQLNTLFTEPGNSLVDPSAVDIRARDPRYDVGPSGFTGGSMTSKWTNYEPKHYNAGPGLDSEYRRSSGVMVNAYTGKMYETFEEDFPPPNTDKSIPPEQLKKSNVKLIQMQGGFDNNAPARKKREVCATVPDESHGPNVWGDQLYADRRRQEMQTRYTRDVWGNRTGIYSVEAVDDRKPVGYVGYENSIRPTPYLPATHRADIDNHGYTGLNDHAAKSGVGWEITQPRVSTTKPVYDESMARTQGPDASNPATGNHIVQDVGAINLPGTNRSITGSHSRSGAADGTSAEMAFVPSQSIIDSVRSTLKTVMDSVAFAVTNAGAESAGSTTIIDADARPTQKGLMAGAFPVTSAGADGTGYITVLDTDARPTQKGLMAGSFPVTTAGADGSGYITIIDTDARETQKGLMSGAFPVTSAGADGSGYTTVIDTDARETLKGLMANAFPITAVAADSTGEGIGMFQGEVKGTKRQYFETDTHGPFIDGEGVGAYVGYGVLDNGDVLQLDPSRGKTRISWVNYSKVPLSGGDTSNAKSVLTYMAKPTERGERGDYGAQGYVHAVDNVADHNASGALSAWAFLEGDGGARQRIGGQMADIDQCPEDLNWERANIDTMQ